MTFSVSLFDVEGIFLLSAVGKKAFWKERGDTVALTLCFDVDVEALLGVGFDWKCAQLFFLGLLTDKASFVQRRMLNLICVSQRNLIILNSFLKLWVCFFCPLKSLLNHCTWTWSMVDKQKAALCLWNPAHDKNWLLIEGPFNIYTL